MGNWRIRMVEQVNLPSDPSDSRNLSGRRPEKENIRCFCFGIGVSHSCCYCCRYASAIVTRVLISEDTRGQRRCFEHLNASPLCGKVCRKGVSANKPPEEAPDSRISTRCTSVFLVSRSPMCLSRSVVREYHIVFIHFAVQASNTHCRVRNQGVKVDARFITRVIRSG